MLACVGELCVCTCGLSCACLGRCFVCALCYVLVREKVHSMCEGRRDGANFRTNATELRLWSQKAVSCLYVRLVFYFALLIIIKSIRRW